MTVDNFHVREPNRPKALQEYLKNSTEITATRIGFLKVEQGKGTAIVFNEGDWSNFYDSSNMGYDKGVDIFPILIDVVVKYEDYKDGYKTRGTIRKLLGKFNGKLTNDREGTIAFKQFLAPVYNRDTNDIVFGAIYLLKQNYDYTPLPTNNTSNNANDTD